MTELFEIINLLGQPYLTRLILLITEIAGLVIWIKFYKHLSAEKVFGWYILFDLILFLISHIIEALEINTSNQINSTNNVINLSVSIFEVFIYYIYFISVSGEAYKKSIKKSGVVPIVIVLLFFITKTFIDCEFKNTSFNTACYFLSSISFLAIFGMSTISMRSIFDDSRIKRISKESRFWITVGSLFYSSVSASFYFFVGFFEINKDLDYLFQAVFFYAPFTLNIFFILMSFLCKRPVRN